ncbi:MAG: carboxylesterase/lipase family protein [Dehalococcoidales bacterium]
MNNNEAIVSTKSGKLEGYDANGLFIFKGIPYAAPPLGDLRWMPPQPVKPWDGVRPAKEYGAICPQNAMPVNAAMPGMPDFGKQAQSEDCLSVNIWTPGLDDARRPVLFWIHGGAFIIGSGSESFLESGLLARRGDIVVVSINYRLGAFGFINLKEVSGGRIPATGSEGLLDQVAALDWVQENIAAFGGNPDDVTIAGFSAGGMSVGDLLSMPRAQGKFKKAINRSGAANVVSTVASAAKISEQFLKILKVNGKKADALRKLTVKQLLDAQAQLGLQLREAKNVATPFQPIVDGDVLPEMPFAAIRKGSSKNIPIMAGTSLDELKATNAMNPALRAMDEAGLVKWLNNLLPAKAVPEVIKVYREVLQQRGAATTPMDIMGTINTDAMFRMPTVRLVEAQRDNGAPAFNYLCTYKSPFMDGVLGAMHGLDNPFLFGMLDAQFTGNSTEHEALALKMQDSCIAFVRTGDPSCKSVGVWPAYGKTRMTMVWDLKSGIQAAPYEKERAAWDNIELVYTPPL